MIACASVIAADRSAVGCALRPEPQEPDREERAIAQARPAGEGVAPTMVWSSPQPSAALRACPPGSPGGNSTTCCKRSDCMDRSIQNLYSGEGGARAGPGSCRRSPRRRVQLCVASSRGTDQPPTLTPEELAVSLSQRHKAVAGATVGTLVEGYDFAAYGTFAAIIAPVLFFSDDNSALAAFVSVATFGVVARSPRRDAASAAEPEHGTGGVSGGRGPPGSARCRVRRWAGASGARRGCSPRTRRSCPPTGRAGRSRGGPSPGRRCRRR